MTGFEYFAAFARNLPRGLDIRERAKDATGTVDDFAAWLRVDDLYDKARLTLLTLVEQLEAEGTRA